MTVSTTANKIVYLGDGATTTFTFPFPGVDPANIIIVITSSTGVTAVPSPSAFSVILNPPIDPNPTSIGGSVTYPLVGPPLALGNSITIIRSIPSVQSTSISNQSIVYPPVVEQEFDYLTLVDQQFIERFGRTFQVPVSDPPLALLPSATMRANQAAIFDASGNLTAGAIVIPTGSVSAAMIPVVTAATLTAARVAMGVAPIDSPIFTGNPQANTPPLADNSTFVATTAFVKSNLSIGTFTTGDLKPTHKTTADPSWILWRDGTIGDATSGSTNRANADTSALFALYYNSYSDGDCPLKTSTGIATTRAAQGTATAAFAAHCRMTLPRGDCRAVGLSGFGVGLTPRSLGLALGNETHVQTIPEMAQHNHGTNDPTHTHPLSFAPLPPIGGVGGGGGANTTFSGPDTLETVTGTVGAASTSISINLQGLSSPMDIMNPTAYINIMIKL